MNVSTDSDPTHLGEFINTPLNMWLYFGAQSWTLDTGQCTNLPNDDAGESPTVPDSIGVNLWFYNPSDNNLILI